MKNAGCDYDCVNCSTYDGCEYSWKETVEEKEMKFMEETRIIDRVGNYSMGQAEPEDCSRCHNAKWGTVLIKETVDVEEWLCLDCYIKEKSGLSTDMPAHPDLGSDCCGFFMTIKDGGLHCNECGMNINEAIKKEFEASEHFKTTVTGLWATDRPDLLTEEEKKKCHLFRLSGGTMQKIRSWDKKEVEDAKQTR